MKATTGIFRNALVCALALQVFQPTCGAQVDPWERVKLVEPGKKVAVRLHSGKTVKGKMELWTSDRLSIRQGKDKLSIISKSDVDRVALLIGKSRGRKALYAGLITGGVMGGLMGAACADAGCYAEPAVLVSVTAGLCGGFAAGIAALFPQHQEILYRAPPLEVHTTPAAGPVPDLTEEPRPSNQPEL